MVPKPNMLALSDIHFHAHKSHARLVDGTNSRLLDTLRVASQALQIAKANDVRLMLIPGDLFHIRGQIKPSVFNRAADWLSQVIEAGIEVAMIPGNHDLESFKEDGTSAVESFGKLKGVTVLTSERPVTVLCGVTILGIPYIHDHAAFKEVFRELSEKYSPAVTLIHQGIDDFDTSGVTHTGLSAEWLAANNPGLVFAGHYHKPGKIGNVVNVGAPLQQTFNDVEQERGLWLYLAGAQPRFIPLDAPKFWAIQADTWPQLPSSLPAVQPGDFVTVKAKSADKAKEAAAWAKDSGAASITVLIEKTFRAAKAQPLKIQSPLQMLSDFCDMVGKYRPHKARLLKAFETLHIGGEL